MVTYDEALAALKNIDWEYLIDYVLSCLDDTGYGNGNIQCGNLYLDLDDYTYKFIYKGSKRPSNCIHIHHFTAYDCYIQPEDILYVIGDWFDDDMYDEVYDKVYAFGIEEARHFIDERLDFCCLDSMRAQEIQKVMESINDKMELKHKHFDKQLELIYFKNQPTLWK